MVKTILPSKIWFLPSVIWKEVSLILATNLQIYLLAALINFSIIKDIFWWQNSIEYKCVCMCVCERERVWVSVRESVYSCYYSNICMYKLFTNKILVHSLVCIIVDNIPLSGATKKIIAEKSYKRFYINDSAYYVTSAFTCTHRPLTVILIITPSFWCVSMHIFVKYSKMKFRQKLQLQKKKKKKQQKKKDKRYRKIYFYDIIQGYNQDISVLIVI